MVASADCRWDHPRVSGEHLAGKDVRWSVAGSSPRERGAPLLVEVCEDCARIIPA